MGDITIDNINVRPSSELYVTVSGDAAEALKIGQIVYPTSTGWAKADADALATVGGQIGMVLYGASGRHYLTEDISSGDRISVLLLGEVFLGESVSLTLTKTLYVSGTAGSFTDVPPTNFRAIGNPTSANTLFFNPTATQPGS